MSSPSRSARQAATSWPSVAISRVIAMIAMTSSLMPLLSVRSAKMHPNLPVVTRSGSDAAAGALYKLMVPRIGSLEGPGWPSLTFDPGEGLIYCALVCL